MPYLPSPQQAAFYNWIQTGKGNAILRAVAGAGKTTTLLEGTRLMQGNVMFMAYGNAAAKDIKRKADKEGYNRPDLRISTVHSACYKAWLYAVPGVQTEKNKVRDLMDAMAEQDPAVAALFEIARGPIAKLVSLGKAFLMGVPDMVNPQLTRQRAVTNRAVWGKLAERYSLFDDLPEDFDTGAVLGAVIDVFERSAAMCRTVIDFDDMIYAPLRFRARFFKQDWVLGDEWQDANPARREAVRRMCGPNTRVVFVGDEAQDIFGFTGTGNDSLGRSQAEFACTVLDLTVSYRCPQAVVRHAQQWVPHIQAHPDAKEGLVAPLQLVAGDERPWYLQRTLARTDAILCRYNKPLVETAFGLLRAGIACKVEGRDIGLNLITLAKRWKVTTLNALEGKLNTYLEREAAKADAKGDESKKQAVQDRVETLKVFIERCRAKGQHSVECLHTEILSLFDDNVTAQGLLTLCSGHKSKGREWGCVYWLETALRTKRALQGWEAAQENNIKYVICTRVEGQHGAGELWLVPEGVHSPLRAKK